MTRRHYVPSWIVEWNLGKIIHSKSVWFTCKVTELLVKNLTLGHPSCLVRLFWKFKVLCFRDSTLKFGSYLCRTEQNIGYILLLKMSSLFTCFSGLEKEWALIRECFLVSLLTQKLTFPFSKTLTGMSPDRVAKQINWSKSCPFPFFSFALFLISNLKPADQLRIPQSPQEFLTLSSTLWQMKASKKCLGSPR